MNIYKKIMNVLARIEEVVIIIATVLILFLTFGNVVSRKLLHASWSFTEELVIAVFVLISLLAAALACRKNELVGLAVLFENVPKRFKKPMVALSSVLSVIYCAILLWQGILKVIASYASNQYTFVLHWPQWIFWTFVPISAVFMILHIIEFCIEYCTKKEDI